MARTASEHVVFMVVDSPVENADEAVAVGNGAAKAYIPVTEVDGKAAGLQWITQNARDGVFYRVGTFSTIAYKVGEVQKVVVKRDLIAQ